MLIYAHLLMHVPHEQQYNVLKAWGTDPGISDIKKKDKITCRHYTPHLLYNTGFISDTQNNSTQCNSRALTNCGWHLLKYAYCKRRITLCDTHTQSYTFLIFNVPKSSNSRSINSGWWCEQESQQIREREGEKQTCLDLGFVITSMSQIHVSLPSCDTDSMASIIRKQEKAFLLIPVLDMLSVIMSLLSNHNWGRSTTLAYFLFGKIKRKRHTGNPSSSRLTFPLSADISDSTVKAA